MCVLFYTNTVLFCFVFSNIILIGRSMYAVMYVCCSNLHAVIPLFIEINVMYVTMINVYAINVINIVNIVKQVLVVMQSI